MLGNVRGFYLFSSVFLVIVVLPLPSDLQLQLGILEGIHCKSWEELTSV